MLGLGLGIGAVQTPLLARYSLGGKAPAVVADTVAGVYGLGGRSVAFEGLFTFSRLSAAWKLNALGHWVKVLAGEPRTGHHVWKGGKLVPAGVAVCSEVRTNHVSFSTRFETGWASTDVTVTANTHVSPDGTMNADTLTRSGAQGYLIKSSIGVTGQTKSIYARTVAGTGTVGLLSHNSVPESEMSLTEEWQEFDLPVDTAEIGGANFYAVDFRIGDLTEIVVWSAQLDDGPFVTDHIPTDGSAVSVAAETLEIDPVKLAKAVGVFGPELTLTSAGTATWDVTTKIATFTEGSYGAIHTGLADGEIVFISGNLGSGSTIQIKQNDGVLYPLIYEGSDGYFEGLVVGANGAGMRLFLNDQGSYPAATISNLQARKVTMPEALTLVMKGTISYADEGINPQVRMMLWQADSSNRIRLQLNTVDARTGQFIAFTQKDGVANSALSASDAYSPGVEVPFSVAAVLTATEIEGFYNGVSTGKVAHGGLPNLLATPMELFTTGTGTIEQFAIYAGNPGSAALLEATS